MYYFMYISVICMCISHMQVCGLYMSFTKHTLLVTILYFQVYRNFGISFACLFVCLVCYEFIFDFYPFVFHHLLYTALFLPIS